MTKLLEMDNIEFTKAILSQLQDNLAGINQLARKAADTKSTTDCAMTIYEMNRLANRHEDMLNLADDLLSTATNRIEQTMAELQREQRSS